MVNIGYDDEEVCDLIGAERKLWKGLGLELIYYSVV
jgi:hypothetical protein